MRRLMIVSCLLAAGLASAADRPYLGVGLRELTKEERNSTGLAQGAVIDKVQKGGGAEKAGLKPGDVVTKLGAVEIAGPQDIKSAASKLTIGAETEISFVRDGKPQTAKLTPVSFDKWNSMVGETGVPLEFRDWVGEKVKWEDLKGKVVVLDFFQLV